MGILQRIRLLLASNINDAISKAENPEKILEQLIIDMRKQLQEAKKEVAVTIADEKRLARQLADERSAVAEWHKKAKLAVRGGSDDLAREALKRKAEHEATAATLQQQWEGQRAASEELRAQLRRLNERIEEARRKKTMLIARSKRAKAQKRIQETMTGLSDTSAFDTFDRMAARVDQIEAEAEASAEIASDFAPKEASLADRIEALGADDAMDAELAALKAEMSGGGAGDTGLDAELDALRKDED